MSSILTSALDVLLELSPWLLLGAAAATLLHRVLPRGFASRNLVGPWGVVKAVLIGVPLPLCSCGVLPTGLSLHKDGASRGATVGFLVSTPQTGVDSVLVSASFLGWPFALAKLAAAGITGLLGGFLTDAVVHDASAQAPEPASKGLRPSWRESFTHGLEVVRMVLPWAWVGIAVSAILSALVPQEVWLELRTQSPWLLMLVALGLSLPLYVCATGSVPIAATLVAHGFPVGAALVFLMAGPATNAGTLGALWRNWGAKSTFVYLLVIVAGSLGFGWVMTDLSVVREVPGSHVHFDAFRVLAALVITAFTVEWLWGRLRTWVGRFGPVEREVQLKVSGMHCGGCARKLQDSLLTVPGVHHASVDSDQGIAVVRGPADVTALVDRIRRAGFEAQSPS
ncbi:MAG: permease [Myxococcota bacterium]